jgi:glycine/D-amino acid oxidase-like deaminating enzyme
MRYCRGEAPEVGVQRFALPMSMPKTNQPWGAPPWTIDFAPPRRSVPASADFAIVGGGFTGLAAAAWLRILDPNKSVVVIEASRIGAGASGRTGGMALGETAAGDLPGLGDVLRGFQKILKKLRVECDLSLTGAWEIGRSGGLAKSPIEWNDSGTLRVVKEVPGGTLDPGKLVSGLARAARRLGAVIVENRLVERIEWGERAELHFARGRLRAEKILFATNALSLRLAGLEEGMHPRLTLAAATAPLPEKQLRVIGLAGRKPFYTVDLPYLWGRIRRDRYRRGRTRANVSGARRSRPRTSSRARVRPVHAPLGRADSLPRFLEAGFRLASAEQERHCSGRLRGPRRRTLVLSGTLGRRGPLRQARSAPVGIALALSVF